MRAARVTINADIFASFFKKYAENSSGPSGSFSVQAAWLVDGGHLPPDAKVVDVQYSPASHLVEVTYVSDAWPDVGPGESIRELPPVRFALLRPGGVIPTRT
jgi:hypothetical protein